MRPLDLRNAGISVSIAYFLVWFIRAQASIMAGAGPDLQAFTPLRWQKAFFRTGIKKGMQIKGPPKG